MSFRRFAPLQNLYAPHVPKAHAPHSMTFKPFSKTHSRCFATEAPSIALSRMRNVAIIAHVDHGKTTLVDCLLRNSSVAGEMTAQLDRVMDSNALEKERGITILAKCTSLHVEPTSDKLLSKHGQALEPGPYRINIVDTPGHADFGGEVERVMSMVDGVVLVVCAFEGPMTQTKFVLKKALQAKLTPIVVINKADRDSSRIGSVENQVFDLFASLDATDEQMDYPLVYASAREAWAAVDLRNNPTAAERKQFQKHGMRPLFDTILCHIPPPVAEPGAVKHIADAGLADAEPQKQFCMLVSMIESHQFFGKLLLGRILSGRIRPGDTVKALDETGAEIERVRVLKLLGRCGLSQLSLDAANTGDIVSLSGFLKASVNSTLCFSGLNYVAPTIPLDPPTLSMIVSVNDSPLAGREGDKVTSTVIHDRFKRECESNVSLQLRPANTSESFEIRGRGELQLGVVLEQIRREGFELSVSPPRVIFQRQDRSVFVPESDELLTRRQLEELLEPVEEVSMDVPSDLAGPIIEKLTRRRAEIKDMEPDSTGRTRLKFEVPTRGLLGFRSEFINDTRGNGVLNTSFKGYEAFKGPIEKNDKGALVATTEGETTNYALDLLQPRGTLFIGVGVSVYNGMVVGEYIKQGDLDVNPAKKKELTNVRSVLKEEKCKIAPPRVMNIEEMIAYVRDDEVIELTPKNIRLRKRVLDPSMRKRQRRSIL